jgi:hypothetical protein
VVSGDGWGAPYGRGWYFIWNSYLLLGAILSLSWSWPWYVCCSAVNTTGAYSVGPHPGRAGSSVLVRDRGLGLSSLGSESLGDGGPRALDRRPGTGKEEGERACRGESNDSCKGVKCSSACVMVPSQDFGCPFPPWNLAHSEEALKRLTIVRVRTRARDGWAGLNISLVPPRVPTAWPRASSPH